MGVSPTAALFRATKASGLATAVGRTRRERLGGRADSTRGREWDVRSTISGAVLHWVQFIETTPITLNAQRPHNHSGPPKPSLILAVASPFSFDNGNMYTKQDLFCKIRKRAGACQRWSRRALGHLRSKVGAVLVLFGGAMQSRFPFSRRARIANCALPNRPRLS